MVAVTWGRSSSLYATTHIIALESSDLDLLNNLDLQYDLDLDFELLFQVYIQPITCTQSVAVTLWQSQRQS